MPRSPQAVATLPTDHLLGANHHAAARKQSVGSRLVGMANRKTCTFPSRTCMCPASLDASPAPAERTRGLPFLATPFACTVAVISRAVI